MPDRYAAWQDNLQRVFGAWVVDRPLSAGFDATMVSNTAGGFQIVDCTCDPCGARRTRSVIGANDRESLTIQLVLTGKEHVAIEDKKIILTAGDVLIWNSIKPMSFEVVERLSKLSVSMPLSRLRSWLPTSWHSIENALPHGTPGAVLLTSVIDALAGPFLSGTLQNGDALTESLIGLLVNVLGRTHCRDGTTLKHAQLISAKRYIEANLSNTELAPATIAKAQRISLRYLHALFETESLTVQQYVIHERLRRCRRELENAAMGRRTITEIAFSWGFQDSAHFGRRFKAEYGMSPQEFRASATRSWHSDLVPA
jgi:AraC-like DNA-binding protein